MKKTIFVLLAVTAVVAVACQRELDIQTQEKDAQQVVIPDGIPRTLTASIDDVASKTSYDSEGKYSWSSDDQIAVIYTKQDGDDVYQGWLAYKVESLSSNGRIATFTIVDDSATATKATYYTDNGYAANGMAVYPATIARPFSGNPEKTNYSYTYNNGSGDVTVKAPFVTLPSTGYTSVANIPLTGLKQPDESFAFKTAGSVIKITINNVPAAARSVVLQTADKQNYPLTGDFYLRSVEDVMSFGFSTYGVAYRSYFSDQLSASILPASEGASVSVYFSLPVGAFSKKNVLSLHVLDGDGNCLDSKYIGALLTTTRNELLTLPEITLDSWTSVGTAAFVDKFQSASWTYAEVELQQSTSNSKKYRLVNPYKYFADENDYDRTGARPDTYFYFTLSGTSEENQVTFSPFNTGIINGQSLVLNYNHWNGTANSTPAKSRIVKSEDSQPKIIDLAPNYCYTDMTNGWPRNSYDNMIRIVFPGYFDHSISVAGLATDASQVLSVSGTKVTKYKHGINTTKRKTREGSFSALIAKATTSSITLPSSETSIAYLGVKFFDADEREIFFTTYPVYHLASADATTFAHTFSGTSEDSSWSGTSPKTTTITLATSDNVLKGNMMITEFDGICWEISKSTHWDDTKPGTHYYFEKSRGPVGFSDGQPIYGYYTGTPSSSSVCLTFSNIANQPLYYDNTPAPHTLTDNANSKTYQDLEMYLYTEDSSSKVKSSHAFFGDVYVTGVSTLTFEYWLKNYTAVYTPEP